MTHTSARTWQYLGLIVIALAMGAGYWYFSVRAGVKQGTPLAGPASSNLVGYWSFDGDDISGTTAYDRSGSGNNGTLTNGPAVTTGKIGQALSFDGSDDYVNIPNNAVYNTANGTWALWVKFDSTPITNSDSIMSRASTPSSYNGINLVYGSTGTVAAQFKNGSSTVSQVNASQALNDGTWHHISLVFSQANGGTNRLYIDGVESGSSTNSASWAFSALPVRLADAQDAYWEIVDGQIDEVRIYNTALTASQIYDLYKLGGETVGASNPTRDSLNEGLAGYWPLDNGSGTTATDLSTNGNNGTLTNGPTWGTGQIGGATTFDGTDDYITAAHSTALNFNYNENFSLALWVKIPATQNTVGFGANEILTKWVNTGPYPYYIAILNQNFGTVGDRGKISFARYDGTNNPYVRSAAAINDNTWHHINLIKQGSILKLYVDGALSNTATDTTTTTTTNAASLYIGEESGTAYPFTGSLDDIRIYNRALTAEEVTRLYKTTTSGNPDTRLKGYWSFDGDSISGTTARDLSGTGNNGTLTNGPTGAYGIRGQALSFFPNRTDTGAKVNVGDPASGALDFGSGDFSVGFWMNGYGFVNQSSSGNIPLSKKDNDSPNTAGYAFIFGSNNQIVFRVGNGTTDYVITAPNATTNDATWHHYFGLRSGSTIYLYIDGVLIGSTTVSGSTSNGIAFMVGDDGAGGFRNVDGSIDEVRVYNAALTASEIWNLYQEGEVKVNKAQNNNGDSLNDGLAGYWKLDDASGTTATDSSGNGNNGTLTNGPTWGTGQIGGDVVFDGTDDYINFGNPSSLNLVNDFSVSLWVNINNITQTGYKRFFGPDDISDTMRPVFFDYDYTVNKYRVLWRNTGTWAVASGKTLTAVQWQHFVITFKDGLLNAYSDGVLVESSSGNVSPPSSASVNSYLGGTANGSAFPGSLDEVRVYNRALSAEEVARLYKTTGPTNPETGLVGYWSFNGKDIVGTTAYDRSGKGNDGTLTSGPTKTFGKIGQALSFDGTDDRVLLGDMSVIENQGAVTFAGWVKPTTLVDWAPLISKYSSNTDDITLNAGAMLVGNNTAVVGSVRSGTNAYGYTSTGILSVGTWTHLAMVFDGSQSGNSNRLKIYVNGVEQSLTFSGTIPATTTANAINLTIGRTGSAFDYWKGSIDEVRVYNRALSATEITNLYNFGR